MFYDVYFCGETDEAYEFPEWETMTEAEKDKYEQNNSQCIECFYFGVVEASSKGEAIQFAIEQTPEGVNDGA